MIVALAPDFEMQDLKLGQQQNLILSIMMSYANQALADRPRDIAASFGLDFLAGFIAVQYVKSPDPIESFMNSYVVGAGAGDKPKFPEIVEDPTVFVGRSLREMTVAHSCSDPASLAVLHRVLTSPPPVPRRPWIRRYRTRKEIYSQFNVPVKVVLENTLFMNADMEPQWMFISIAERGDSEPLIDVDNLESDLFLTSSGFDSRDFSWRSDEAKKRERVELYDEALDATNGSSSLSSSSAPPSPQSSERPLFTESSERALLGSSNEFSWMRDFPGAIHVADDLFDLPI